MEAGVINTLIEDILVTWAKVSKQSTPFLCLNPLTTKHALYFSMDRFGFNFLLKIHLQPIVFALGGKSTISHV